MTLDWLVVWALEHPEPIIVAAIVLVVLLWATALLALVWR